MSDLINKSRVPEAVREDGRTLVLASEELRADRDFMLEAVRQGGYAPKYASLELKADIIIKSIAGHPVSRQDLYLFADEEVSRYKYDKTLLGRA